MLPPSHLRRSPLHPPIPKRTPSTPDQSLPRFAISMSKELYGANVGVAIDDTTGHYRATIRLFSRNLLKLRHEIELNADVSHKPNQ